MKNNFSFRKFHKALMLFFFTCISLYLHSQPVINSFSPTSGTEGTVVNITGTSFSSTPANNIVYFGGVRATVVSASANTIKAVVPNGATYQPISVTVDHLVAYSSLPFVVTHNGTHIINDSTFAAKSEYISGKYVFHVAVADLDIDGKLDLISSNYSDLKLSIFRNLSNPQFINLAPAFTLTTHEKPGGMTVEDVDGDGKKDIIIVEDISRKLSVFRNISTPGHFAFDDIVSFPTGTYPVNVEAGDIDSDGKTDIIVTNNQDNNVSVFKNNSYSGVVSFEERKNFATGASPYGIAVQDMNADGKPELVVSNYYGNSVSVLINSTMGNVFSFKERKDFNTGIRPYGLTIGDLDNDGTPDIITANVGSNNISVLKNLSTNDTLLLQPAINIPIALSPNQVAVNDIDGDGKIDLTVTSSDINIHLLKNISTRDSLLFEKPRQLYLGGSSEYPVLADMDGDGKPDLVVGYFTSVAIFRSTNYPSITSFNPAKGIAGEKIAIHGRNFSYATSVFFNDKAAASFDVVSDSLIVATLGYGASGSIIVKTVDGFGARGGFKYIAPPVVSSVTPIYDAIGTDVIIKGKNFVPAIDSNIVYFGAVKANVIAATDSSVKVSVPVNISYKYISLTCNRLTAYAQTPFSVKFSSRSTGFEKNDFIQKAELISNAFPIHTIVTDIDNDRNPDIITANFVDSSISVFHNNSTTDTVAFNEKKNYSIGFTPKALAFGDFNGDGMQDIAVTNSDVINCQVSVFKNESIPGNIKLSLVNNYSTGIETNPTKIEIADFDGDGRPDIAIVTNSSISIFRNESVGGIIAFSPKYDLPLGEMGYDIFASDFNRDGKTDIAAVDYLLEKIYIFKNTSTTGNISFNHEVGFNTGFSPVSVCAADLDGDSFPELAVTNAGNNSVSVLRNICTSDTINFEERINYPLIDSIGSQQPGSVFVTDMDGDGKPDLITGNKGSISVLKNNSLTGNIKFENTVNYFVPGNEPKFTFPADVNGDGKPDLIVDGSNTSVSVLINQIPRSLNGPVVNIKKGNWSDPETWLDKQVPKETDDVILNFDVNVDINVKCKSLKANLHKVYVKQNVLLSITGH